MNQSADDLVRLAERLETRSVELGVLAVSPTALRDLLKRLSAAESKVDALMREREEYRKEFGIRQNMTATTRLHNICKGLEYDKKDSPYSAEAWDQLVAENAALMREKEELIERCAKVCEEYSAIRWDKYKRGDSPDRADPHIQGQSDGADDCAAAIRALKGLKHAD